MANKTTSEVLDFFRKYNLTRDLLYYWERRTWVRSEPAKRGKGVRKGRTYSEEEVQKIGLMLRSLRAGYSPEQAANYALGPQKPTSQELTSLLRASDSLAKTIVSGFWLGDRRQTVRVFGVDLPQALAHAAREAYATLEVESCAIALVDPNDPDRLFIVANKGDKDMDCKGRDFRRHQVPGGGLTGYMASQGRLQRLNQTELANHPFKRKDPPDHLASGECYSRMMVPLQTRVTPPRIVGWIIADNRKGPDGQPGGFPSFDEIDAAIGTILANQIVVVLELLRMFEATDEVVNQLRVAPGRDEFLNTLLKRAQLLVRADRGDVYAGGIQEPLTLVAKVGKGGLEKGDALPVQSLCRRVYERGEPILEPDVQDADAPYHSCCAETRCEMAVPLFLEANPQDSRKAGHRRLIGVLNLESFEVNGFDERDLLIIRYLVDHAMPVAYAIEASSAVTRQLARVGQGATPELAVDTILRSVQEGLGFDCGIIYMVETPPGILKVRKSEPVRKPFEYRLQDRALATKIFHSGRPYFSADPKNDPEVNIGGLEHFEVTGPLIGVPLKIEDTVVGVLVVWSKNGPVPERRDCESLARYAQLAVTTIAVADRERKWRDREREWRALASRVLSSIQKGKSSESESTPVRRLLSSVRDALGFDRARVFRYQPGDEIYTCVDSIGVDEEPGLYAGPTPVTVRIADSQYSTQTRDNAKEGIFDARLCEPSKTGVDPDSGKLGKPNDLPFAVAPLVINGELYGYIAADNAKSRREISPEDLSGLHLFSVVAAALAIAGQDESRRSGS
jgi:GAF domain-containing protein